MFASPPLVTIHSPTRHHCAPCKLHEMWSRGNCKARETPASALCFLDILSKTTQLAVHMWIHRIKKNSLEID